MAILDQHLVFSDNVAPSGISDVIDRGADAPVVSNFSPGFAGDLFLVIQTGTALTGGSLTAELISDSVETLDDDPTVHASTGAIPAANLTANNVAAVIPVPPGDYQRFVGVRYSGDAAGGTVRAFLTNHPGFYRAMYANNPIAHTE